MDARPRDDSSIRVLALRQPPWAKPPEGSSSSSAGRLGDAVHAHELVDDQLAHVFLPMSRPPEGTAVWPTREDVAGVGRGETVSMISPPSFYVPSMLGRW